MPDNNKIILGTNDDTYIAADDSGNIVLQHEGGNRISMNNTSITPASDEQIDLGSATNKFRDLYLSSDSLYVGNTKISADPTTGGLTSAVANEQGVFGEAAAVGGADTSNLNNPQETVLATWVSGYIGMANANTIGNVTTFQFETDNQGGMAPGLYSNFEYFAQGTLQGPGNQITIPYPVVKFRLKYSSGLLDAPEGNAIIRIKNKENIPAGQFMTDFNGNPWGASINPDFDHFKLIFFEEGVDLLTGNPTSDYYWRMLDADGNDVDLWDPNGQAGMNNFANYQSPFGAANFQFGTQGMAPIEWAYQQSAVEAGTLPADAPQFELIKSTNEVEMEESLVIKGEPYSNHGLIIKNQAGNWRRLAIDSVGNVGTEAYDLRN